jgi:hypothetical protein
MALPEGINRHVSEDEKRGQIKKRRFRRFMLGLPIVGLMAMG